MERSGIEPSSRPLSSCHESCFPRPAYRFSMVVVQRRKGRSVVAMVGYFEWCRWGDVSIGLVLDGARGWLIIDRFVAQFRPGGGGGDDTALPTSAVRSTVTATL